MRDQRTTGKHEAVRQTGSFRAATGRLTASSAASEKTPPERRTESAVSQETKYISSMDKLKRPVQPYPRTAEAKAAAQRSPSQKMPVQPELKQSGKRGKGVSKRTVYIVCTSVAAVLIIIMAFLLKSANDKHSYDNYYQTAISCYTSHDYDSALASLRKAQSVEDTDECLLLMAYCYEAQLNYDKCLECLRAIKEKTPDIDQRILNIEAQKKAQNEPETVTVDGKSYSPNETSLVLKDKGYGSYILDEIVKLYALNSLTLSGNSITDISAISSLGGLTTLDLSGNIISDLAPLSALTGLRTLYLDGNPITDFTPLYSLSSLTTLSIKELEIDEKQLKELSEALPNCAIHSEPASASIIDITLGGITFKSDVTFLDLSGSGITDISALSVCRELTSLNLENNDIRDLSPLMDMPYLATLNINDNSVKDLRPIMAMSTITSLKAANNEITSTVALSSLTGIRELNLRNNPIEDYSGLEKLRSLTRLDLQDNNMTDEDIESLKKLLNLGTLDITGNTEISGEAFDKLQSALPKCRIFHSTLVYSAQIGDEMYKLDSVELDLSGKNISDLSNICLFNKLEILDLSDNAISNLYYLEWSKQLKQLDLSNNQISDITELSALHNLVMLDLRNNEISSVQALMMLTNLEVLYLSGNSLTLEQIDALRAALPYCDIHVE